MVLLRVAAAAALAWSMTQAPPAESPGTPAARTAYDAGMTAAREGDYAKAIALFRKAIGTDPRFVDAHEEFISISRIAAYSRDPDKRAGNAAAQQKVRADLEALYEGWARAHPDNAVYEWALAEVADKDWTAAEAHLKRAIAIDPSFARPYEDLALVAELRGDNRQRIDYLKKASDMNPTDASYFFYYASAMKAIDPAASIALMQKVADRFPGTERAAQGLYWAAYETEDMTAKLAIYDRLRKAFAPEKFSWSESGMSDLFDVLVGVDPAKARALAADMQARVTAKSEQKNWADLGGYATALAESSDLRAKGDGKAAVRRLDGVKTPRTYMDQAPLAVARAAALEAAADPAAAYASLVDVAAKTPSDALLRELTRLGAAMKKDAAAVSADLRARREAGATAAPPFTLPDYPDRKNVSLADYKGKVVLINFWYPSCGPCRGEFPTLQRVLDKYKDRGFVILSLNVLPEEHDFVMPYLTKNGFTFRPLETTTEWAEKTYGARGFPTNLLVDAEGRIVYKPGIIRSPREQRTFELQIESLLQK
jgi:tetratricopeptide (TPR) repeat protein